MTPNTSTPVIICAKCDKTCERCVGPKVNDCLDCDHNQPNLILFNMTCIDSSLGCAVGVLNLTSRKCQSDIQVDMFQVLAPKYF